MPKYYIQSGTLQFLTSAEDSRSAALWALHCWLDKRMGLDSVSGGTGNNVDSVAEYFAAIAELSLEMRLSESGFGGCDAGVLETGEVIDEWICLWTAVDRLPAT